VHSDSKSCECMLSWINLKSSVDWIGCACNLHDKFGLLCGLEQMIKNDVMTNFDVLCELEQMWYNALMT
jgi:hypothetical protein